MKKGLTELVFVLDRSGSMSGLERDTIGGFNRMIEKQKAEPGEVMVTTVLFDHQYEVIHDRFPIHMIRQKEQAHWEFIFLGANMDAVSEAEKIGIAHDRAAAFENDSDGVQLNYEVITETISAMRACAPAARIDGTWKKKIDDDYKKREETI